jgi:[acyl-carrier-protein] S-malonyltransferase
VGVISAEQAMVLVRERGKAMADAAARSATSMTAVLGGDRDEVLATLERHGLTAANDNGPGQVVAAGTEEQLAALADDPPEKARLSPLSVAGAFHTEHMKPAVDVLAGFARAVSTHDPRTRLISNRDGQVVHDGQDVLRRIVGQVATPVRWDLCMETMRDLGVTGMLEMPPAGTLTGIARRALKGVETLALKTPDQLDDAREFAEEHADIDASPLDAAPTWRLLVSPAKGTFNVSTERDRDKPLQPRERIGTVRNRRDEIPILAPHGGTVVEWLVEDGDLVAPGQPLVRLHPEGAA